MGGGTTGLQPQAFFFFQHAILEAKVLILLWFLNKNEISATVAAALRILTKKNCCGCSAVGGGPPDCSAEPTFFQKVIISYVLATFFVGGEGAIGPQTFTSLIPPEPLSASTVWGKMKSLCLFEICLIEIENINMKLVQ